MDYKIIICPFCDGDMNMSINLNFEYRKKYKCFCGFYFITDKNNLIDYISFIRNGYFYQKMYSINVLNIYRDSDYLELVFCYDLLSNNTESFLEVIKEFNKNLHLL